MNLGLKSDGGLFDRVSSDCHHWSLSASEKAICTNFQLFFVALVDRIRRLNSLQEAESALGTSIASGNDPEPGAVLHAALCDYEQYYGAPGTMHGATQYPAKLSGWNQNYARVSFQQVLEEWFA